MTGSIGTGGTQRAVTDIRKDCESMESDWWKRDVVNVPRPIPAGKMLGMRGEHRDGRFLVVEFLEDVPGYQPNPFSGATGRTTTPPRGSSGRGEEVLIEWSAEGGFSVYDGKSVQGTLF